MFRLFFFHFQMKFSDVQKIFYQYIHRRYHRYCRELFVQLISLNLNIKPAYLFDLFPLSMMDLRNLLDRLSIYLSFHPIILKYSLNDIVIVSDSQLSSLLDPSRSVLVIDLNTMDTTNCHPILDKVVNFLV